MITLVICLAVIGFICTGIAVYVILLMNKNFHHAKELMRLQNKMAHEGLTKEEDNWLLKEYFNSGLIKPKK